METYARARGLRFSAQKARLVADQIRGLPVMAAMDLLSFSPKRGAAAIKKVLASAIANAENRLFTDIEELKIRAVSVDAGPSLKRSCARAKGRSNRIVKRSCHVTIKISG